MQDGRMEKLSNRALGRATLARQMLLERSPLDAATAVDRLVGLQAQVSDGPYQALWSRLAGFRHEELTALIVGRTLVRATSLRATLHLHTVADLLGLRPLVQAGLDRMWQTNFGNKRFGDADPKAVHRAGVKLLDKGPLTGGQLGAALQEKFPGGEALAKSTLLQMREILVQIPPTRVWGSGHAPLLARAENWVGVERPPPIRREELVLRYLRAFGPASAADMQAWSGMTRLGETFAGVREQLIGFVDEAGRELFDVPDAPRPDADMPVPVRFLGDFDNVVLGFAERSRIVSAESQKALVAATRSYRAVLVDGVVAGSWSLARSKGAATLTVTPFALLSRRDRRDVEAEGTAFLRFMAEGAAAQEVIVVAP
jgi:hypothetical protein